MCCNENQNNNSECACLSEIIRLILKLQNKKEQLQNFEGCDKPFLGPCPSVSCFNTRPVSFYTCCSGTLWTLPYMINSNNTTGTSSVFRVEDINDCCCTCRILAPNPDRSEEHTSELQSPF